MSRLSGLPTALLVTAQAGSSKQGWQGRTEADLQQLLVTITRGKAQGSMVIRHMAIHQPDLYSNMHLPVEGTDCRQDEASWSASLQDNGITRLLGNPTLVAAAASRQPVSTPGALATMPTLAPPSLPKPVTMLRAEWGATSCQRPSSATVQMTSRTSYGAS